MFTEMHTDQNKSRHVKKIFPVGWAVTKCLGTKGPPHDRRTRQCDLVCDTKHKTVDRSDPEIGFRGRGSDPTISKISVSTGLYLEITGRARGDRHLVV